MAQHDAEHLPVADHLRHSPKLQWLLIQLDKIRQADGRAKVIVFTEFRQMQRLIQRAIPERFGVSAPVVNGSTTVDPFSDRSRQATIDRFQQSR